MKNLTLVVLLLIAVHSSLAQTSEPESYFEAPRRDFNLLKYAPLEALNGDIPLRYERVVSPRWSVEATLGLTWGLDFWEEHTLLLGGYYDNPPLFLEPGPQPGYLAGLALRWYPVRQDDAPEGFSLSAGYQYKRYNTSVLGYDANGNVDYASPRQTATRTIRDNIRLITAYNWHRNVFYSELYFGLALRSRTAVDLEAAPAPGGGYRNAFTERSDSGLGMIGGIQFGVRF